jgi:tetratricopeptide (TPR) repeat protein
MSVAPIVGMTRQTGTASRRFRTGAKAGRTDNRVVLPGDEGDGQITIQVDKSGAPGEAGRIEVSTGDTGSATPAGSEARSYMALGDTHLVSGEYDKAIAAYRLALSNAGDEGGYLYQQIAECYRRRGDKESAVTNYENAIKEYHRLIDTGRRVEDAKDGIRACERAIKTCSY